MIKLPPNRVVAFFGPGLSIVAGVIADWLLALPHGPDILGVFATTDRSAITAWLTQALVFSLTAILTWAGQQKWLTGWIAWESTQPRTEKPMTETPPTIDPEAPPVDPSQPTEPIDPGELPDAPAQPDETPAHPTEPTPPEE